MAYTSLHRPPWSAWPTRSTRSTWPAWPTWPTIPHTQDLTADLVAAVVCNEGISSVIPQEHRMVKLTAVTSGLLLFALILAGTGAFGPYRLATNLNVLSRRVVCGPDIDAECKCMQCGGEEECPDCQVCGEHQNCISNRSAAGCYGVSSGSTAGTCNCAAGAWTPEWPHTPNITGAPAPLPPASQTERQPDSTTGTEHGITRHRGQHGAARHGTHGMAGRIQLRLPVHCLVLSGNWL